MFFGSVRFSKIFLRLLVPLFYCFGFCIFVSKVQQFWGSLGKRIDLFTVLKSGERSCASKIC